jgi:hypothetical protein
MHWIRLKLNVRYGLRPTRPDRASLVDFWSVRHGPVVLRLLRQTSLDGNHIDTLKVLRRPAGLGLLRLACMDASLIDPLSRVVHSSYNFKTYVCDLRRKRARGRGRQRGNVADGGLRLMV